MTVSDRLRLFAVVCLLCCRALPVSAQDDPRQAEQWHLDRIGAQEAWTYPVVRPVTVAVLDTGIDYTHPDLAAHIWQNLAEDADGDGRTLEYLDGRWQLDPGDLNGIDDDDFDGDPDTFIDDLIGWDFIDDDNDPMDGHGHGTHVAGLIGAVGGNGIGVAGVARSVQLMGLRIGYNLNTISVLQAIRAADYAREHDVRVINNSWGTFNHSANLEAAAKRARDTDILWVAASGFSAVPGYTTSFYPAAFRVDNILSVGSASRADAPMENSNYDPIWVDLVAPAEDLLSTALGGGYATSSGTSMAAAVTSGAAAQLLAVAPTLNYGEVRELLEASTTSLEAFAGNAGTSGRLHVARAFELLLIGLRASSEWFIFAEQFIGQPVSQQRIITNFGLNGVVIELGTNDAAFTVKPQTIDLAPGDSSMYTITFVPAEKRWYGAQLTLQAGAWEQVVQLRGQGVRLPQAQVQTVMHTPRISQSTFELDGSDVQVGTVELTNIGDLPLNWTATLRADTVGSLAPSVRLTMTGGKVAPAESVSATLLVDPGFLPSGTYTVEVILATNGVHGEVSVPVTFAVERPGFPALTDGDAAWGDYDLDGDLDLVMTGFDDGKPMTLLLRNDGSGRMVLQVDAKLLAVVGDVAWGEPTGQGGLYLALADTASVAVVGLHAANDTTLTRWPALGHEVDWADFDGDGDLDLVGTTGVLVRADSLGVAERPVFEHRTLDDLLPSTPRPQRPLDHAAWADYDRDGDLDLLATGADGIWLMKHEDGMFAAERLSTGDHRASHPAWIYADVDQELDAVTVAAGRVQWWRWAADAWQPSTLALPGLTAVPRAVQWADVDADLALDLLTLTNDKLHVYSQDGSGFFERQRIPVPERSALALGRLTDQSIIDLALTGKWPNADAHMPIYRWNQPQANTPPFPPSELLATVDGDRVTLTWGNGWDRPAAGGYVSEQLVTYDLVVKRDDGTPIVFAEVDDEGTSRWVMRPGKLGTRRQWSSRLPPGTYRWTVRTVDGSFLASRVMPLFRFEISDGVSGGDDSDDTPDTDDPDIEDPDDTGAPEIDAFALHAAYPNPFATTTRIAFDLPVASFVRLTVSDLLGRTVTMLFDGSLAEGQHEVLWDAGNHTPGLYLVRIETPTWQGTRTVVLAR